MSACPARAMPFGWVQSSVARLAIGCMRCTTACVSGANGPGKDDVIESKKFGFFATNPNARRAPAAHLDANNGVILEKTLAYSASYEPRGVPKAP